MKLITSSLLFLGAVAADEQDRYTAHSSPSSHILAEKYVSNLTWGSSLIINSDAPVTLQKYSDTFTSFLEGEEPVPANMAMVVVSSNCSSDDTDVVPEIEVSATGTEVTVTLGVGDAIIGYLEETTSYSAFWSYVSFWCGYLYTSTTIPEVDIALEGNVSTTGAFDGLETPTVATIGKGIESTEETGEVIESTEETPDSNTEGSGLPTGSPTVNSSGETVAAEESTSVRSSGFSRHSSLVRMTLTLMAVVVVTLALPGREGNSLFGFGKVFVVAAVASSLLSRSDKNANVVKIQKYASDVLQTRNLQAKCIYNVELLYDGCTKNVEVNAPAARVLDVVMEDYASETNEEDKCQTDYSANLTFPVSENTTEIDLSTNNTVAAYTNSDWQCERFIEGRPFIDGLGKGIQALPVFADSCVGQLDVEWSGGGTSSQREVHMNATTRNQNIALGDEWIQRALGEHSSIASFAAFSIALMTNQAPSSFVEDALKAGLDEINHARVSFQIASKLLGTNVEPGFLPESKHEFVQNMTALALAVAREGCVDETLSAFAAAAEVDSINQALEDQAASFKYSDVDRDTLRWIGSELEKIAIDEANHSALAWRTLKWVCSVDSKACMAVHGEVFDDTKLEMRFQQRSEGNATLASLMKEEWNKVYNAASTFDTSMCTKLKLAKNFSNQPFISRIAESVLRDIVC